MDNMYHNVYKTAYINIYLSVYNIGSLVMPRLSCDVNPSVV